MADIAMCFGESCDKKELCYRYTAPVNEYMQTTIPAPTERPCRKYWNNKGKVDGRKIGKWWKVRSD